LTELKTLKDLNLFNDDLKDDITKEKIKAEAVKIAKESLDLRDFGEKMFKFFEIKGDDLK